MCFEPILAFQRKFFNHRSKGSPRKLYEKNIQNNSLWGYENTQQITIRSVKGSKLQPFEKNSRWQPGRIRHPEFL
jgi:hypothetical protein